MQDKKNIPSMSLGTQNAKKGEKNKIQSNVFVTTQKTIPVIDPIIRYSGFEKAVLATKLIEISIFNFGQNSFLGSANKKYQNSSKAKFVFQE